MINQIAINESFDKIKKAPTNIEAIGPKKGTKQNNAIIVAISSG